MARTSKRNPWVIQSALPLAPLYVLSKDSQTWKAGEFGYFDANGQACLLATDGTKVNFQFLQDQATSTSSTKAWVGRLTSDTIFEGYVSNDDADVAAAVTAIGQDYGIHVGSNYHTVNTNETSNVAVTVLEIAADYSPYTDTTSTSPGKVKFRFKASVVDAS